MIKLLALLAAITLTACGASPEAKQSPEKRGNEQGAIACYDPNPNSATPEGILHPRACRLDGMTLHLVYESTFPKAPPGCCLLDKIHAAPVQLAPGDSHTAATANANPDSGALTLTAPDPIPIDPAGNSKTPSVGLFATDLSFGQGTIFSVRATFRNPAGPLMGKAWAVGISARDGRVDDNYDAMRLSVSLRAKAGGAMLNIAAGAVEATKPPPADIGARYDAIYRLKQPFTLGLLVDRTSGKSIVTLETAGFPPLGLSFEMSDFRKDAGPVITAIGPALADCCVAGANVSVEVTDFQIWVH